MYRLHRARVRNFLPPLYAASFFLGLHYFLTSYINSSFIESHFSEGWISLAFAIGALLNIVLLYLAPRVLQFIDNKVLALWLSFAEFLVVYNLPIIDSKLLILTLFVLHIALAPIILYCLDIFMESATQSETSTGRNRALFNIIQNITVITSLVLVSAYVTQSNLGIAYKLSAISLIPLVAIISVWTKGVKNGKHKPILKSAWGIVKKDGDTLRVIIINLILQCFFAWIVIYAPLLMLEKGFEWQEIGIIILIAVTAYVLFEFPEAYLADNKIGEKEIIYTGLVVMGVSSIAVSFLHEPILWTWAIVFFITRIGASLLEVGTESYFFKRVKEDDSDIISVFRVNKPLSFLLVSIALYPILHFYSYSESFIFLGALALTGLFIVPRKDTR